MSQPLNNLDIIILIILGLSALIALSRGLIKEVLSIIGWVLGSAAVIYLLPVFTPITKEYISNGMIAGVVTSDFVYGYLDSADRKHRRQGALQQIKLG